MSWCNRLKEYWGDLDTRTRLAVGYLAIGCLALALIWSLCAERRDALEKRYRARQAVYTELLALKGAYRAATAQNGELTARLAAVRPDDSVAKVFEETGVKGKGVKIAPLKAEERGTLVEEAANVKIEAVTGNEAVNLIYRLEQEKRPVALKGASLRVRFDDPSRLDLSLDLALMKPAPGRAR